LGEAPEYRESHLSDLHTDPYEFSNLIDLTSHASLRAELRETLLSRMKEAGEGPVFHLESVGGSGSGQRRIECPNT
jgi:hypothetical protein